MPAGEEVTATTGKRGSSLEKRLDPMQLFIGHLAAQCLGIYRPLQYRKWVTVVALALESCLCHQ